MAKAEKKTEEQAVAVKPAETGLTTVPEGAWGAPETISRKEILIPKLLLMQGVSQLVSDEKAAAGDIVNSVSAKILGGKGTKSVEIIPIMKLPSTWVINELVMEGGALKKKFKEMIEVNAQNENWDWTIKDAKGNVTHERDYTINFFVLVVDDITGFPYQLSFRRTSLRAGKKLSNHFQECMKDKVAPARYALKLSCRKEMKDKQAYWVYELEGEKRKTSESELSTAYQWFTTFKDSIPKIDQSDLEEADETVTTTVKVDTTVTEKSQY
jgi:hypothetical protein